MKSFILSIMLLGTSAFAAEGLTIHTLEYGVGKFHRYDNQVHAYAADNAWAPYVLPANAPEASDQPLVQKNSDGSYTIFYATLDSMMKAVAQISKQEGKKVSTLNVHGHGLPGGMWFPKDSDDLNSSACADWVQAARGGDLANYNQYYSEVSVSEIQQIEQISNLGDPSQFMGCISGLRAWTEESGKVPAFKASLADDAQLHFLSCVVGMGTAGETFTNGVAQLLLSTNGHVATSMEFGLGDWSMPEGMGFWNYKSDSQVDHDNQIYVVDRKDREIMQKGRVRISSNNKGQWQSSLLADQDFLKLSFTVYPAGTPIVKPETDSIESLRMTPMMLPTSIRIPGTTTYIPVRQ